MKHTLLGIALCALAMPPDGAAIARHSVEPSSLTGYVGKYPWIKLRGIAAMKDRHARTEVATAVCSHTEVENERLDWCVDGNVVDTAYPSAEPTPGCPAEAGDLASLDTISSGAIPK